MMILMPRRVLLIQISTSALLMFFKLAIMLLFSVDEKKAETIFLSKGEVLFRFNIMLSPSFSDIMIFFRSSIKTTPLYNCFLFWGAEKRNPKLGS